MRSTYIPGRSGKRFHGSKLEGTLQMGGSSNQCIMVHSEERTKRKQTTRENKTTT